MLLPSCFVIATVRYCCRVIMHHMVLKEVAIMMHVQLSKDIIIATTHSSVQTVHVEEVLCWGKVVATLTYASFIRVHTATMVYLFLSLDRL